jgi:heme/copper-type cytochrome/quinol oxidase subunit 2
MLLHVIGEWFILEYRMIKKQTLVLGIMAMLGLAAVIPSSSARALECSVLPDSICKAANEKDLEKSGTWLLLIYAINILTVAIGVVAVAMIAFASFMYTTAGGNAEQTKKAIEMIRNVVIALVIYAMMWALLQWLVPGGIFK